MMRAWFVKMCRARNYLYLSIGRFRRPGNANTSFALLDANRDVFWRIGNASFLLRLPV